MPKRPQPSIESIETSRLKGRRVREADFAELAMMGSDKLVMATLGGTRTEQQTRESLDTAIKHWDSFGYGFWIFRDKLDNRFVGRGGLRRGYFGGNDEVEVAYALSPEFWNQGLATEIATASANVAFNQVGLSELVAFTLHTNAASCRVMEKSGFTYEKDIIHAGLPHVFYRAPAPRP